MTEIMLAAIVVLLVVIAVLLARRSRRDSTDLLGSAMAAREDEHARASGTGSAVAGTPEAEFLVQQVRMLMNQRKKIPAVKLWRDATGASLADAVKAVEQIAAGGTPSVPKAGVLPTAGLPVGPMLGPELMTNARDLKRQGRAIEAIKLVRQHTGLGLREAKDVVDEL
ncbi:ribosomal protein L7/L12 [Catellatospora aurea]|uniref:Ribosomal protein L7/L12 n=1 Tax=Catellatospora aurea TaxID=1337874 RepID=A0ABW2GZH6_9ACTN